MLQAKLLEDDMNAMGPAAAMIGVELDLGGISGTAIVLRRSRRGVGGR